jgi:hypothetical protein
LTVVDLMSNPAASPVVGRPVQLAGKAIGRVNPGFIGGEDVIYQDRTGLVAVDFRSMLGFLGDLYAGWRRVPKHFAQQGSVTGWFRRSMGGYVILSDSPPAGRLRAHPYVWQVILSLLVIGATLYLGVADAPLWPLSAPGGVEATP